MRAQRSDGDHVVECVVGIQGDVAAGPTPDHEFSPSALDLAADQRVALQQLQDFDDVGQPRRDIGDIVGEQVCLDAIEIVSQPAGQHQPRHDQPVRRIEALKRANSCGAIFRGFGLAGFSPRASAVA